MTRRSLPPTTTGATAPGTEPSRLRTSTRARSFTSCSAIVGLLTVRMPSGSVPVGSNGRTTGGNVLVGRYGRAASVSELLIVIAVFGSTSSRKYTRTTLTPVTDRDSTLAAPGDWFTHRSMRSVSVRSTDRVGIPL